MESLRLDLHTHSRHSPDSFLSIDAIAGRISALGLHGFAVTDHNTVNGHREIPAARARHPELLILPGVEVSTREGHLLVYGVSEAPARDRAIAETIDWARAHGGVAVLSHPFRRAHGVGRVVAENARVPAVETVNGHNSPRANGRAADVATRRRLGATGGSDGHALADLGQAFTVVDGAVPNVEAVLAALGAGRTTASGRSLTVPGRLRYEWHTAILRLRRGFRPI